MSGGSGQAGGLGQSAIKPLASLQNAAATVNQAPQGASQNSTGPVFAEDAAKLNVGRLYQDQFGRQADQDGLNFWVNQMRQGQTLNDIRGKLASSAEAQARQAQQGPAAAQTPAGLGAYQQTFGNMDKQQLAEYVAQNGSNGGMLGGYAQAQQWMAPGSTTPVPQNAHYSAQNGWQGNVPQGPTFSDYAISVLGQGGYQDALGRFNQNQYQQLANANNNQLSQSN
ncbi:DUF4214 domain-containing protein [Chelatococcus sp.]|uniref:DUF4214 domain-containing protein n=1 Tax=Chelatococcus sp. TaxID=1953771 RepID=UPI001ED24679|nr:DUF4214 domain-containing protein [Chelatococcus sp.]MBX3543250.1 DUF4214 domain-containing protein [Chelatococcus sp.]